MNITIRKLLTLCKPPVACLIQSSVMLFCNPLCRFLTFLCGGVGLIILGIMTRRWWRERTRRVIEQTARRQQDSSRRKRRRYVRNTQTSESQQCVVCCQNPREIILLPCGHVSLCGDCSERIIDFCPVCRAAIETKADAYIP